MRVCFISPYSPKEISGVGIYISELSKGLSQHAIESRVITRKVDSKSESPLDIIEIEYPRQRYLGGLIFTYRTLKSIIRFRKKMDIVLLQRPFTLSQAVFALIIRLMGLPIISVIHGRYPAYRIPLRLKLTKLIERFTFLLSESVVFVDKKGMQLRGYKKGVLIENGVDTSYFRFSEEARRTTRASLKITHDELILILVGRISFDKGIYELFEAVYKVNKKGEKIIKALLIGPIAEKEEQKINHYIQKRNIKGNILFLGVKDTVQPFYCAADVFVLPSYEEGLPLTLLEAMACNLPVIVSDIGGIPFVIENFKDGFLIKPGDSKALEDKIRWYIQNPDKMKEFGMNACKKVNEKYSLERMTRDYVKVLKQAVR